MLTHEAYIHKVRDLVLPKVEATMAQQLATCKLVYGIGKAGLRGVTYYDAWRTGQQAKAPCVEVTAMGEEHPLQLAGTTIHELGHVLAGYGHGHDKEWLKACATLGLRNIRAAGTVYQYAMLTPDVREKVWHLAQQLADGKPAFNELLGLGLGRIAPRPCPMGIGTRGGTSRGTGSGSRLRLWQCACSKPVKVRIASDDFDATCNKCGSAFKRG